tara:strand:+ start:772 stop:1398 length:627 start_codon:yes stop_codon:yes gene_type:complete
MHFALDHRKASKQFTPAYNYHYLKHPFVRWRGALNRKQVSDIIARYDALAEQSAIVGNGSSSSVRQSKVCWIPFEDEPALYNHIAEIAQQLNGQFFGFDLWGFKECIQYTKYEGSVEGHYDWHQDSYIDIRDGIVQHLPRKLSLTIQLSDTEEYEGGDLEVFDSKSIKTPRELGSATAFAAFMQHRVTPVTNGIRRSLVAWATGPAFR